MQVILPNVYGFLSHLQEILLKEMNTMGYDPILVFQSTRKKAFFCPTAQLLDPYILLLPLSDPSGCMVYPKQLLLIHISLQGKSQLSNKYERKSIIYLHRC